VENYIHAQQRFRGIDAAGVEEIQRWVDTRWEACVKRASIAK
jgi:hypothetical protein